ncbi:MAG: GNAT family N-acetyltransferase [Kiritimatiellaeota bacterium]|nr:GNAT family N-acetyltransferase [Kiritimatiellota bacterium]
MNRLKNHVDGIFPLDAGDVSTYAEIIRQSFATVARDMNLTRENCPHHPSFITDGELLEKHNADYAPYGLFQGGKMAGFVSLTHKGGGVYMMNKLSVLPECRHNGLGQWLLDFCKAKVREWGGSKMEIDLVEENTALKNWYAANGFTHTGTKRFPWFPFTVGYMEWKVDNV